MSLLAAHFNDAGISVLDSERILYREPGFALLDDDGLKTGHAAFANARIKPRCIQNRFWSDLQTTPLGDRRFHHLSSADLVSRQLEQVWAAVAHRGDRLVVAVPAYMGSNQLALLLGIAAELGVPVVAMVDAAVAATRREYRDAVPVHVDLSLHATMLTRIAQPGQAQAERTEIVEESGLLALNDSWLRAIAEAFVQQSRFDPLHTAETEQVLQNQLASWIFAASANDSVEMEINYHGIVHTAVIESLALLAAAAPVYQSIISRLRALYRADETPAIQLSDRAARMPGLADMLVARVGGQVFLLEAGATARGLITRCRDMTSAAGGVSLLRTLPWDQSAISVQKVRRAEQGGRPTHVLFEHVAYEIDDQPINMGSQPENDARWIDFRTSMPGVSRRHCTLQRENGQCVVRDFSRYGTFLNGHAIDGSAVLQVGDLIRLGAPGFELRLITTEEAHGS
ncbi:MAG: FHA domain-containing protein [Proteobacteria bacterium]|nr:FHA domain-containing protein [Pseudomonadota bacterium]MDA1062917.1 FHA domain-containing protein [Pseudomonadota bacterium]